MKTVVYMPGVWDLLHIGHVMVLKRARKFGDVLIVGVPSDEVVKQDKGHYPIIPCEQRCKMLQALKCVDLAIVYDKLEFVTALRRYDVDVLVIGEYWGKECRHVQAVQHMKDKGGRVVMLPYTRETSTSEIIEKIKKL